VKARLEARERGEQQQARAGQGQLPGSIAPVAC